MKNYFRITGYCPEHDFSFIIDSNGMFEKLWQFSSYLIQKGLKVLEVSNSDQFLDVNIEPIKENNKHIIIRATADGKPKYIQQTINGITYKAVKVAGKIYTPDNK
jgi:hypothetical protein